MAADDDLPVEQQNGPGGEAGAPPQDEVAMLRAQVAELKDRALRAMADSENTRKRADRERAEASAYAIARFARDMLSVSDNLRRALDAVPAEALAADEALKAIYDGVAATERELQSALARHGVTPVAAEGARFDPNLHQAIAEVPSDSVPPGYVAGVVQSGYMISERLLRPAMVTVARAPSAPGDGAGSQVDTKL